MKTRSFLAALVLTPLLPLHAQQKVRPASILGTWRVTSQHPSGTLIKATVRFTQDKKFTSSTTANDKPLMNASGTWELEGGKLQWTYESSSHPAIAPGYVDTDDVLGLTGTELRLKSRLSGKVQDWQKVQ